MEIARMFGQLPAALLALPLSEYRRLQHYYFAVKEAEKPKSDSGLDDLPPGIEVLE